MFSQYTWGDFFKVMVSATVVYYVVVGWVFYREKIRNFLTPKSRKPTESPSVSSSNDDEDEAEAVSIFYNVTAYQGAPAKAGALAQPTKVDSEPAPGKDNPEKKASASSIEKAPTVQEKKPVEPVEEIQEVGAQQVEFSQEDEDSLLTDAPPFVEASTEEQTHLLFSFGGQVEPQNEQDLQAVVETAREIEIQPDGVAAPKSSAGREANLLADKINGQQRKSVADILETVLK